jgi:hypothetical protein
LSKNLAVAQGIPTDDEGPGGPPFGHGLVTGTTARPCCRVRLLDHS